MKDDRTASALAQRSWLERLGSALLGDEPKDLDALVLTLREAQARGLLDADALAMMEGVLQVSEMQVRDVMIPRAQMVVVGVNWPMDQILETALASGHSRFPVIGEDRDEVVGILLGKDLLRHFAEGGRSRFADMLRPARFIPESKRLNTLLKEFRSNRMHLAIVADEYGGVAGLVTIEDVLEQIVGEIEDEHDIDEEGDIRRHGEREYIVKALTSVEDFNEYFGSSLDEEKADTVGGLVMMALGRMPRRGEEVDLGRFRFKVLRADNRRVHLLDLTVLDEEPGPPVPSDTDRS